VHIISVWNPKGGQGKTTFAINLCALAAKERGMRALLVDTDHQGSAAAYAQNGKLPFEVVRELPSKRPDVDLVVIDHQATDWELPKADLIVMPTRPGRDQWRTTKEARRRALEAGKRVVTVLTDYQVIRPEERRVYELLEKEGAFCIPSSGVFSRASAKYQSIFDDNAEGHKLAERQKEIRHLLTALGVVAVEEGDLIDG
jgi:chromosome partitioning protein